MTATAETRGAAAEPLVVDRLRAVLPPDVALQAVERRGPQHHAIVVDKGQDFGPDWLLALEALSFGGREDVLYVFHDPARAIYIGASRARQHLVVIAPAAVLGRLR